MYFLCETSFTNMTLKKAFLQFDEDDLSKMTSVKNYIGKAFLQYDCKDALSNLLFVRIYDYIYHIEKAFLQYECELKKRNSVIFQISNYFLL